MEYYEDDQSDSGKLIIETGYDFLYDPDFKDGCNPNLMVFYVATQKSKQSPKFSVVIAADF